MANKEKELIASYVLQNEGNLEVALKIAFAFDEIRKKIILDFLEALEKDLSKSLDHKWVIKNDLKENVFDHWRGLYITKNEWREDLLYRIGFASEKYGARGFIIGVTKKQESQPIEGGKLNKLLGEKYKPGLASSHWEWYQWVEGNYGNWDNEEVLIKMYQKQETVSYFKEQILRIKEIAEPIIDEAVKSTR